MKKSIANIKKELKNEAEKCPDFADVQISGDGTKITLKKTYKTWKRNGYGMRNEHYTYTVEAKQKMNMLFVTKPHTKRQGNYGMSEFAAKHITSYFIKYAQLSGIKVILFKDLSLWDEQTKLSLLPKKDLQLENWKQYGAHFEYAYEVEPGAFNVKYEILGKIASAVKEIGMEIPSLAYESHMDFLKTDYTYYYNGYEGAFSFEMDENDQLLFQSEGEKIQITPEQIKDQILSRLNQVRKTNRLHNLYNPPRKMFDEYMDQTRLHSIVAKDSIFIALSSYYKPEEIDEKIAIYKKNQPRPKMLINTVEDSHIYMFELLGVYFVFKGHQIITHKKEQTETEQILYTIILETAKLASAEKFKDDN